MSEVQPQVTPPVIPPPQAIAVADKPISDFLGKSIDPNEKPSTEPPKEAPKEKENEEKDPEEKEKEVLNLSRQFAALTKKERELRGQRQALKEFEDSKSDFEFFKKNKAEIQNLLNIKKEAKRNPKAVLDANQITYDDITQFLVNNEQPTVASDVSSLKSEVEKLKEELKNRQQAEERSRQEYLLNNYINDLDKFIKGNSEKYELVNANNALNLVYDTITEYYNQNKRVLSHDEACELVENYLENEATKLLSLKKLQAKITGKSSLPEKAETKQSTSVPKATVSKTLTNEVQGSSPTPTPQSDTEEARFKRALALLKT